MDSVDYVGTQIILEYSDGDDFDWEEYGTSFDFDVKNKPVVNAELSFQISDATAEVVILSVSYLKNGAVVGSSLIQHGSDELKLLKYKVELPRGAKVTLFDDETLEAKFVAWNLPCPNTLPNMTFLQVKAANGREAQITPSAGSQTIELYTELGRRYAVFGEIWAYSFAQALWFADLRVQLSDDTWQDIVPTAGEGGTVVTALPL